MPHSPTFPSPTPHEICFLQEPESTPSTCFHRSLPEHRRQTIPAFQRVFPWGQGSHSVGKGISHHLNTQVWFLELTEWKEKNYSLKLPFDLCTCAVAYFPTHIHHIHVQLKMSPTPKCLELGLTPHPLPYGRRLVAIRKAATQQVSMT